MAFILRAVLIRAVLIAVVATAPAASWAGTYWASPTGTAPWASCQGSSALAGAAACSIATANANAAAGDIVQLRGGTYSIGIAPARSGTSGAEITYVGFAPEIATIVGTATAINASSRSYLTVKNVNADGNKTFVDFANAQHVSILNCTLVNSSDTGGWPTGIRMYPNARYNRIANSVIGHVGYSTIDDDIGGVMTLGAWDNPNDNSGYNLLENNTFFHGGHHIIDLAAKNNIIRNNVFHNENWMPCARPASGNLCGNRAIVLEDGTLESAYRNVIEGNRFAFMGEAIDDGAQSGVSVRTPANIVRRNVFYLNAANGLNLYTDGTGSYDARLEHIYNNTFYRNGLVATDFRYSFALLLDNVNGNNPPIPITGNALKNNLFFKSTGGDLYFYYTSVSAQAVEGNYYATASQNSTPMGAMAGNTVSAANPLFVNIPTENVANIQSFDFQLQPGSLAIERGVFLTTAVSAGSGTTLVVADAGYFIDGFGIAAGDVIQLQGQPQTARVVAVNYVANTLTLDTALSWAAGQGVGLPYAGSVPDSGAHEFGSVASAPAAPQALWVQ